MELLSRCSLLPWSAKLDMPIFSFLDDRLGRGRHDTIITQITSRQHSLHNPSASAEIWFRYPHESNIAASEPRIRSTVYSLQSPCRSCFAQSPAACPDCSSPTRSLA